MPGQKPDLRQYRAVDMVRRVTQAPDRGGPHGDSYDPAPQALRQGQTLELARDITILRTDQMQNLDNVLVRGHPASRREDNDADRGQPDQQHDEAGDQFKCPHEIGKLILPLRAFPGWLEDPS